MPTTCLITPAYGKDIQRFVLLRESLEACGVEMDHVVVVHTEDVAQFKSLPNRKRLEILTTEEILPAWLENRRVISSLKKWDPRRLLPVSPIGGWSVQMYTKIFTILRCNYDTAVCIDSDMVAIRKFGADDFHTESGTPHLYRFTAELDVEMVEWVGRSMRLLGVSPCGHPAKKYTYSPLPIRRDVLVEMTLHIQRRYQMNWIEAFMKDEWVTEYATYGAYAEHVDKLKRVTPVIPKIAAWCFKPEDARDFGGFLRRALADPCVKLLGIQSNMGIASDTYADQIKAAWKS